MIGSVSGSESYWIYRLGSEAWLLAIHLHIQFSQQIPLLATRYRKNCNAKGFIHTLEAILATFLVIGFVTFIMPSLREPAESGQIEVVRMSERLATLDASGGLSAYLSGGSANLSGLRDIIILEANSSYQYAVGLVSYSAEAQAGNKSVDIIRGNNNITRVTAYAGNSTGTIIPDTIVWDSGGPKDIFVSGAGVNLSSERISESEVNLTFTGSSGTGEYRYIVTKSEMYGSVPDNKATWISAYIPSEVPGVLKPILTVAFYN